MKLRGLLTSLKDEMWRVVQVIDVGNRKERPEITDSTYKILIG